MSHAALAGVVHQIRRLVTLPDVKEWSAISFWEYCKVGIPLTVLTIAIGITWLEFVHY